jgi:hypothetical protein
MRKYLLMAFFACVSVAVQADSGSTLIDRDHFAFIHVASGVVIDFNSKIGAISKVLGKPTVSYDQSKPNSPRYKNYLWSGLELSVLPENDIIIYIRVSNKNFKTRDGVRIGDSVSGLNRIYGPPAYQRDNYYEVQYSDMSETWGLGFTGDDKGTILEMRIGRAD